MKALLILITSFLIIGNACATTNEIHNNINIISPTINVNGKINMNIDDNINTNAHANSLISKKDFKLSDFPFPKELNMRMYSVTGGVYEYVGNSADGKDVQVRYSNVAGTDAKLSNWKKVNAFVASENKSLAKNGKVVTYPITDSGVFHVKSTVTMKDGQKVKYLRIFPGNDMRFDLMVYSKDGDFAKINLVVEKFMDKLRGNKAFSHLYKGKRNISAI
jgi:hypothetical protein